MLKGTISECMKREGGKSLSVRSIPFISLLKTAGWETTAILFVRRSWGFSTEGFSISLRNLTATINSTRSRNETKWDNYRHAQSKYAIEIPLTKVSNQVIQQGNITLPCNAKSWWHTY